MSAAKPSVVDLRGPLLVQVGYYDLRAELHLLELSVPDITGAVRTCRAYIEEEDLGSSNWAGGAVFRDDGTRACVAIVSYNGRVWVPSGEVNPEGLALPSRQEIPASL